MMRHLIFHNLWLKLFSIALATVIWLAIDKSIQNEKNASRMLVTGVISVPVGVDTEPGDKRVFRINPKEVAVMAAGKDAASFQAARKEFHVTIDVTRFDSTEPTTMDVKVEAPPDINVMDVNPSTVQVQVVPK
jgi:YbbR domain-containing protein